MAKILGNDVVTTEEFNNFKASFLVPHINKTNGLIAKLKIFAIGFGVMASALAVIVVLLINK
jgi:hypothetical protein